MGLHVTQRQSGGVEDRPAGHAALMLAGGALPVQPPLATERRARLRHAAGRADEARRPARGNERLLASLLSAVAVQELWQRQTLLELNLVHRHGTPPVRMCPSSAVSGSQREPAEHRR